MPMRTWANTFDPNALPLVIPYRIATTHPRTYHFSNDRNRTVRSPKSRMLPRIEITTKKSAMIITPEMISFRRERTYVVMLIPVPRRKIPQVDNAGFVFPRRISRIYRPACMSIRKRTNAELKTFTNRPPLKEPSSYRLGGQSVNP